MHCSNCGLPLDATTQSHCPRCGWPVNAGPPPPRPPEAQDPSGAQWQGSGKPPASAPLYAPPGYPPYGQLGSSPSYGAEGAPPGYPSYGRPTGPSVPLYGQPMPPPPGYPPYGQGAPPTVPLYGQGAPGGMYAPPSMPMYGQGMPPGYPMAPQQQPRKSRAWLWVTLGLVVVLVVCGTLGLVLAAAGALSTATTANTTATATPTTTLTPTPSLRVVFQDPLTSNTNGWSTGGQCNFASNGYHIKNGFICYAPTGNVGDATVSVDAKLLSGSTTNTDFGIALRRTSQGNYYQFGIDGNSEWDFGKAVGNRFTSIVDPTPSAAIHGGLNTANTLQVVAKGSHFDFFVNGTKVGQADDSTFTNGKCGLYVTENAESVFTNISVAVPQ